MTNTALIIGASRGIGRTTADMLRERDWMVEAPARNRLDMSSTARVERFIKAIVPLMHPVPTYNAIVFSAGEWVSKPIDQQGLYDFERQFHISVVSQWLLMVRLMPVLYPDACIVAVASTRGFIGGVNTAAYSVAKAAQIALMQGFAREHGDKTRFNIVAPGLTDTAIGAMVRETGGCKPDAMAQPPEAVASVIVGLIEDGQSNGRVVRVVDGEVKDAKWIWE